MKVSLNWLKDYVNFPEDPRTFCEAMTMSGTKAEGYEDLSERMEGILVGRVNEIVRHPDSDHMFVCQIDVGGERPLQIVTGAQNVHKGDLVPVCTDGSRLPGGKVIRTGKLRGVLSEGMLCSIAELGMTKHDYPDAPEDGIFLLNEFEGKFVPGDDMRDVLGLRDVLVEFELTFNRPDCLAYRAIAKEAAATFHTPLRCREPQVRGAGDGDDVSKHISVEVRNPALCPRYTARVVKNVKIGPSPLWMRERLRNAGIRPINNIVDITNYVLVEFGQPMHAFDARYIQSRRIVVRNAEEGETITTLDGVERKLSPEMLCIADGDKPVALAGVMGGLNSEILDDTDTVVFESANFARESIRKTSRAVGLRTESSAKFEKGLPPCNTVPAVQRACELVEELGCGEVVDGLIDLCSVSVEPQTISFDWKRVNGLLGTDLTAQEMADLLRPLDILWDGNGSLTVPADRMDLINDADIAEEVGRLYGFDNIPATSFRGEATEGGENPSQRFRSSVNRIMTGLGFDEVMTYSFVSPKDSDRIRLPADSPLRRQLTIRNPLGEDTSVMRTHALPSMLDVIAHNVSHRVREGKLFEVQTLYYPAEELSREERMLCFAFFGDKTGDFYDLKGYAEALLSGLGVPSPSFRADPDVPYFHPGRCAGVFCGETRLGTIGQVHPAVCETFETGSPVFAALLSLKEMAACAESKKKFVPLPVFQSMERDLAVLCDADMEAGTLCALIRSYGPRSLSDAFVFDVYQGKGVEEGRKSLAVRLVFRMPDRTMTDEEADNAVRRILLRLEEENGIKLRS
ncbi:MAG: phenylalanine--tRNA ligase subunit beta [Clostridia bacterium]|nr:phenylalanine--tRNA ligase subunit beta [Clostridia bacterium]